MNPVDTQSLADRIAETIRVTLENQYKARLTGKIMRGN